MSEYRLPSLYRVLAALSVALMVAGSVSSLRIDDDSYQHFARSVIQLSTFAWRTLATDVWNKPIIAIIYGIPGLLGIVAARWVSVAATVGAAYFTARLSSVLVVGDAKLAPWIPAILFATQLAVLNDSFVTMTEIPAAFLLSLSLWLLFNKNRPGLSAVAAGGIPLCRVELLPISLFLGLWLTVDNLRRARTSTAPHRSGGSAAIIRCALPIMLVVAPFCVWWVAGALVAKDVSWFSRASYAHLRSWDLQGVLRYNVLNRLALVGSPPTLVFLFLGLIYAGGRLRNPSQRWQLSLLLGVLAIHYALLNTLVVYPSGSYGFPDGHAIAAVNARNYTPTAPVAALFAAIGVADYVEAARHNRLVLWKPTVAILLALFAIGTSRVPTSEILFRFLLLAATSLILFGVARRSLGGNPAAAGALAGVGVLCLSVAVRPFFWYPTRWNDRREASVHALAQLITAESPPRVVQDLAASLDEYSGNYKLDAAWTYPQHYLERLRDAPDKTIVVVRTGKDGTPHPRYPAALIRALTNEDSATGRFQLLQRYTDERKPAYLYVLDDIAAKRDTESWLAFRLRAAGAREQ